MEKVRQWHIVTLFFLAFSSLGIELLATKLLSFAFWNHIVYLIISLALLGYGIASTFLVVFRSKIETIPADIFISSNVILISVSAICAIIFLQYHDVSTTNPMGSLISLLIAYVLFLLPFFFAGNAIVYIFYLYPMSSSRLYFWDLIGASLGCLLFSPVMEYFGAVGGIILILLIIDILSLIILINSNCLQSKSGKSALAVSAVMTMILLCLFPLRNDLSNFSPDRSKSLGRALDQSANPQAKHEFFSWDVVTRMDIVSDHTSRIDIGWTKIAPAVKLITFDGDAISQIRQHPSDYPSDTEIRDFIQGDLHVPFLEKAIGGDHLIIGIGGGPDVARSLLMHARSITAVDINEAVIKAMKGAYAGYSGSLLTRPNVQTHHSEGRSFLKRVKRQYDLIQLTGVDTFTALNSGAYVLAENYLYTVEAIRDYYHSLSDNGVLCIHRWFFANKPRESLRLFSIMLEALRLENVKNPEDHLAVVLAHTGITFLKKTPFTKAESDQIARMLQGRNSDPKVVYLPWNCPPDDPTTRYYYSLVSAFQNGTANEFYDRYEYDVSPVTDIKPFFFSYYKVSTLLDAPFQAIRKTGPIQGYWSYFVFIIILVCASIAVLAFIFIPLFVFRREGLQTKGSGCASIYFFALGMGFIMIEISLMQKFALFLGHPMYSISTVIGGMLLFAGLGSHISAKLSQNPLHSLRLAIIAVSVMIVVFFELSPIIIDNLLEYRLSIRIFAVILMLAPLTVALGFFFPIGLKLIGQRSPEYIPWAWGINSGFTVIGSILAIVFAMMWGFDIVMIIAALIYIIGLLSIERYERLMQ